MGFERRKKWVQRAMTFLGMLDVDKEKAKDYARKWNGPAFQRAISLLQQMPLVARVGETAGHRRESAMVSRGTKMPGLTAPVLDVPFPKRGRVCGENHLDLGRSRSCS